VAPYLNIEDFVLPAVAGGLLVLTARDRADRTLGGALALASTVLPATFIVLPAASAAAVLAGGLWSNRGPVRMFTDHQPDRGVPGVSFSGDASLLHERPGGGPREDRTGD
jgi:hypothetical protein